MAKLNIESRLYRLTGLTPILGSLPAIKEIRTDYVTSKAQSKDAATEEAAQNDFNLNERGLTVFARDKQRHMCVMGYQVKGFFKAALYALRAQCNVAAYKSKVDLMLFIEPRFIPLKRQNGENIEFEDCVCERPLRSQGPQGERVALAASEQVDDPWSIEIEISLLPSVKSTKSEALTWETVEAALDYGAYHGLGQWRNADYGRFIWERIDEPSGTNV